MHAHALERYESRDSLLHALDPRVKVLLTFLFIISTSMLPDGAWWAFVASWAFLWLATYLARFTMAFVLRRSVIALPFALAAVTLLFTVPGPALLSWQVGGRALTISEPGLVRFAGVMTRSWLSVQMAILLTASTPFPDLMHALRHLRVPHVLIAIIGFMYRYLFVLADEARRLLRAREARSAAPAPGAGGSSLLWRARVAGNMVGTLFLRSMERSERVYNAMVARAYRGRLLTLTPHAMARRDWLATVVALLLFAAIQALGRIL
ncbi:MAG TPA: cobalt ECF transporter T component CbiQ [Candidatus Sulfomarinibacteraceae bacterium]|nr:cobalt ECF transporter T component CbiQ [Candidatus Sulfomarinibacteraceae bacterium]